MKAPKNFYNTVDQSKLGIDDLFTRTAENEADITAIDDRVEDLETTSEQYHDDIADLKTADTLINNRIDGHLLKETTTSADEGKIMAVDNTGAWALALPASGGDVVVFPVGITSGGSRLTLQNNKTMADVASVLNSNKMPMFYEVARKQFYYPGCITNSFLMPYNITFDNNRNIVMKIFRIELSNLTESYNYFSSPNEYTFNHV